MSSGLYGINYTNREDNEHWTKNCFNSSFPAALLNYMRDNDIKPIYLTLNSNLQVEANEIEVKDLFKSDEEVYYAFESVFQPYEEYAFDHIDGIDLVIKDLQGNYLAPLEVKLTVYPTSQTAPWPINKWGAEMVIRSATTSYCAFGMWDSVKNDAETVRSILEPICSNIGSWTNTYEMGHKTPQLVRAMDSFQRQFYQRQKPLVVEPLWKTMGQSPVLAHDAFDVVVWSDFAFSRLFLDSSYEEHDNMPRPARASAKLARCLWELSKSGKIHVEEIYRQMAFGNQTDKEFAISGPKWRTYIDIPRLDSFVIPKEALDTIIVSGNFEQLKPERRFDQTLYFMYNLPDNNT